MRETHGAGSGFLHFDIWQETHSAGGCRGGHAEHEVEGARASLVTREWCMHMYKEVEVEHGDGKS